ncbi:alpha/beta fold hydrolase [Mesorhizobium sp. B3-1-6]|uniref:alpha/beta hydrolase family protein n=1 Tax=Mesorhizobium sp. B3-1-6 TaxID=2589895 RepID=UPI00112DFA33|nr:alpha/beta fold hydrolase [Mesorhizobium sp. B3-1-6]TPI36118.1 alpha/beta fold hydrolase [Mesorhizobium sp. B3-1-6]
MTHFLFDGDDTASVTILLAHGAGASMDSPSMTATAKALAAAGFQVARFEFHYMAVRRYGHRKPPPRAETVNPEYVKAILDLRAKGVTGKLIIGGKSMGGRVASMVADEMYAKGEIAGLICLGYPFHPPGRPEQLRTKHLLDLKTPTLIFQGTRDEFGIKEEVATYGLSSAIKVIWLEDGDHDLKPRKAISGFSTGDHLKTVAETTKAWAERPHRSSS